MPHFLEAVAVIAVAIAGLWFGIDGLVYAKQAQALGGIAVYIAAWGYCFIRFSGGPAHEHAAHAANGDRHQHV
jgi:hypothetical protein